MTLTECIEKRGWNSEKEIVNIVERMRRRISSRIPDGEFRLTKLQQEAIDKPGFWRDWDNEEPQNLMIQGATSAGKTLLAELAVIDTLAHGHGKAIILVPLKSMVNERKKQFSDDVGTELFGVYAASSDYMENDERLIRGEYDVAIIVYEKFFAMLSQENQQLMQNCSLLVVDELAMLSKEQRGPKLELALEMVRRNHPKTRIMCLATSDCSSEKVCRWLNIDKDHYIFSAARPVALEEHLLLLDGQGRYRTIPANCEELAADGNGEILEEKLTIPGFERGWKVEEKKKQLLQVVLKKLFEGNADCRILIFVATQSEAAKIASYLRSSMDTLFPPISQGDRTPEYNSFLDELKNCEEDDEQINLIGNLIPHRIAYHHAGLSVTLRELIEAQFQMRDTFLKVIVATETLTIGVNMPFDAMIMLSNRVPRGEGALTRLTQQEYRNYIGRAGRLGQCSNTGITYLFLEEKKDMSYYWNSYNNKEEIESALVSAKESYLAPYYLSLLQDNGRKSFTLEDINDLFQDSLTHVCNEKRTINESQLYSNLYRAYLANEEQLGAIGKGRNPVKAYSIDGFGTHMAPYAFSTQTCIDIYEKFYDSRNFHGLPQTTTSQDIEKDRYLLDILYHVCRHEEIERSSVLSYPKSNNNPRRRAEAKKLLIAQLRHILEEEDEKGKVRYELWEKSENNDLYRLMTSVNLPNESDIAEAAMRAVLLFYWTQGKTVKEIRKITEFQTFTKVTSGDIERMAEVASFHLDAIYKCISTTWYEVDGLVNSFYILQARVKYGMTWNLVKLANKHVHGLDRNRLLRLEEAAKERGMNPVNYLYYASRSELENYITRPQINSLMEALERRSEVNGFESLLEVLSNDAGSKLTDQQKTGIRQIYESDGQSAGSLYRFVRDTVNGNDRLPDINVFTDERPEQLLWISDRFGTFRIGVLMDYQNQEQILLLSDYFSAARRNGDPYLLLMVINENMNQDKERWKSEMRRVSKELGCSTVFDNQFFAMIVANAILKGIVEEDPLTAFLDDARGMFSIDEYKFFSVENYIGDDPTQSGAEMLLICDRNRLAYTKGSVNTSELQTQIGKQVSYGILSWGKKLERMEQCNSTIFEVPIILLLEREMIKHSRSLHSFMNYLHQQNRFRNSLLILSGEEAQQKWNDPNSVETQGAGECSWSDNFCAIGQVVVHDVNSTVKVISDYRTTWRPGQFTIGVSYAHEDSFDEAERKTYYSDISLLTQVVDRLRSIYGEHQILFDQFKKAGQLFDVNRARERSLNGYRTCEVFLVLWNNLTIQRVNCENERAVIEERCKNSNARTIYLRPARAPEPPESEFALDLNENSIPIIVREVERILNQIQQNETE